MKPITELKALGKYEIKVDEKTFQPYFEVCGQRLALELISDTQSLIGKEQAKGWIRETYGEDVYEELKDLI